MLPGTGWIHLEGRRGDRRGGRGKGRTGTIYGGAKLHTALSRDLKYGKVTSCSEYVIIIWAET